MEAIALSVEPRQERGKEAAGRLRRDGKVPCVFYGPGRDTVAVCVDAREFLYKVRRSHATHLIRFQSNRTELDSALAMIKEVQSDPVTNQPLHVDFYAVDEKRKIQAAVPIHCVGKAAGVTAGGTLQIVRREVSVEGLPLQLPQFLEVDVTALGVHQTVHIGDLILPAGITAVGESHLTVVTVLAPVVAAKEEAEEAPTEEAGEQEVAADDGKAAPGAP